MVRLTRCMLRIAAAHGGHLAVCVGSLSILFSGCATTPRSGIAHQPMTPPRTAIYRAPIAGETFIWPVRGAIVAYFDQMRERVRNKGIDIAAEEGTPVRAAQGGTVVFAQPRLRGFGNTLIIEHGNGYQTVYAYNGALLKTKGEAVSQNDVVAKVGSTGRATRPMVHFEIRKNGRPIDPLSRLNPT